MTLLLVDSNNLLLRSHLSPHGDMSVDNVDTGTLVVFVNMLARYMKTERPDRVLCAWDGGASAYRLKLFPEYKKSRKQKHSDESTPPFDLVQRFLRLAGFPQLQLPGYEGDDVIAAIWRAARHKHEIVVLSSDKDMMQLIEAGTCQIKLGSRDARPDKWDRTRVITDLGYRPENIVSIMALMGDKVDDIPGLEKVGPKTAVKMLKAHDWSLSKLLTTLPESDQNRVLLNLALVDLSTVPLELEIPQPIHLTTPKDPKWDALAAFCDQYELKSIKMRLEAGTLW